jgi:hypothetical protein
MATRVGRGGRRGHDTGGVWNAATGRDVGDAGNISDHRRREAWRGR